MKSATGSTLLLYIIIIIVGIVGAVFIASNNYTKAYKAKNGIISIINNNYIVNNTRDEDTNSSGDCFEDESIKSSCIASISSTLKNMGYIMNKESFDACDNITDKGTLIYPESSNEFEGYCIYKTVLDSNRYYYTVVTFNHMNINVLGIGTLYKTPVYGQTRIYYAG